MTAAQLSGGTPAAFSANFKTLPLSSTGWFQGLDGTFFRTSPARQFNINGELEYAAHNFHTYTENWEDAGWTETNGTLTAAPSETVPGYDASVSLFTEGTDTAVEHSIGVSSTFVIPTDQSVTAQILLKANVNDHVRIAIFAFTNYQGYFNISSGSVGTATGGSGSLTSSITSLGNDYYLIKITDTPNNTAGRMYILSATADNVASHNGGGVNGFYGSAPQFRLTNSPDVYIKNTGVGATYAARGGDAVYKPVRQLLAYPANANKGTGVRATVSPADIDGPRADLKGDKIVENSDLATTHYIDYDSVNVMAGQHTGQALMKADERRWIKAEFLTSGGYAYFDLTGKVIGTTSGITKAHIINAPNGYYRIAIIDDLAAGTETLRISLADSDGGETYDGDGSSGAHIAIANIQPGGLNDFVGTRNYILDTDTDGDKNFNGWAKTNAVVTDGTLAPDGSTDADTLADDNSTGTGNVSVSRTLTFPSAGTYRVGVFIQAKQLSWVALRENNFGLGNNYTFFDLANGAIGATDNNSNSTIKYWGNGYYICSFEITVSSDLTGAFQIWLADADNDLVVDLDGTSDVVVWNAFAQPLDPTTGLMQPPVGMPQTAFKLSGYQGEGAATNICPDSEDLSSWTKFTVADVIDTNVYTAVDGETVFDRVNVDASAGIHGVFKNLTTTANTDYVLAKDFKPDGARYVWLNLSSSTEDHISVLYDLLVGIVVATDVGTSSGTIADYGVEYNIDGTLRCWMAGQTAEANLTAASGTADSSTPTWDASGRVSHTPAAGEDYLATMVQCEAGTEPTSYIRTGSSSESRSADLPIDTDISWFNQTEGTFVIKGSVNHVNGNVKQFGSANDNTTSERHQLFADNSAASAQYTVRDGGSAVADLNGLGTTVSKGTTMLAAAYKENDIAACQDGGTVKTDTSNTLPTITQFEYGVSATGGNPLNGSIESFEYYNTRLTDAQLQEKTLITETGL